MIRYRVYYSVKTSTDSYQGNMDIAIPSISYESLDQIHTAMIDRAKESNAKLFHSDNIVPTIYSMIKVEDE